MKIRKADSKGRLTLGPEGAGKWFQITRRADGSYSIVAFHDDEEVRE